MKTSKKTRRTSTRTRGAGAVIGGRNGAIIGEWGLLAEGNNKGDTSPNAEMATMLDNILREFPDTDNL